MYDIAIIGAGPAGLTSALYAGRAKMKTIIISEAIPGGQTMLTQEIENYPGFALPVSGPDLMNSMYEQTKKINVEFKQTGVLGCKKEENTFVIDTEKENIQALSLIIATGASYKKLGVPGEEKFIGRGVSYCGVCDAPFFRNKEIALVGGGNTALYEAGHLLKFCSTLHLIHRRDRLRATKVIQTKVLEDKKTIMHWNSSLEEIYGTNLVEGIVVKDIKTGKSEKISCKGVFIFVGIKPNTDICRDIITLDDHGYIATNNDMETSSKGVFACGDVRQKLLRQISTAVGDGATAAFSAQQYVEELKGEAYK